MSVKITSERNIRGVIMTLGEKIRKLRAEKGITQKQLAEAIGVGRTTITQYENNSIEPSLAVLKAIANYFNVPIDYLLSDNPKQDTIEFLEPIKQVPLYSAPVSAGDGVFPDNIYELERIPVFRGDVDFAVKVVGDSMSPTVPEGCLLLVRKQDYAMNGDMIVCTYDGWVYVKWYIKRDNQILLMSDNPNYAPIVVQPDDRFIIHGVVLGTMCLQQPKKTLK